MSNSPDIPLLGFINGGVKKKRKITKNSGHLRLCQQPRAVHALRTGKMEKNYASADGGPRSHVRGNFPARVSAESILPNFPIFQSK